MEHSKYGQTVVILTALDLEYSAIRAHLTDLATEQHDSGTLFEVGYVPNLTCRIVLAVTGEGNTSAAVIAERAIAQYGPAALLFVGVAGALKDDIALGDVVVGTKIYDFQGGKAEDGGFYARPRGWEAPHELVQAARHIARTDIWVERIPADARDRKVQVHFKPVAAGDVVLNSRQAPLAQQLHQHYNDAAAIEMESAGAAHAAHCNRSLPVLTVRGISDLTDGEKHYADKDGWQHTAVARAAAFALTLAGQVPHAIKSDAGKFSTKWILGKGIVLGLAIIAVVALIVKMVPESTPGPAAARTEAAPSSFYDGSGNALEAPPAGSIWNGPLIIHRQGVRIKGDRPVPDTENQGANIARTGEGLKIGNGNIAAFWSEQKPISRDGCVSKLETMALSPYSAITNEQLQVGLQVCVEFQATHVAYMRITGFDDESVSVQLHLWRKA
ncbi:5'-methylthioadenosine/S-adenosylhomocysteine nucleosidase [Nonomuraea sp. NEAU-A123]|uniref:5'-methylthioadenosine/S-adenosylhomocysteine nucleosidase family protein n=1 Tax=Nonomuraea sp. NEAU-A123 TaxID=2839649 RepID=UPI001BE47040|nr:5'-methylthioadenosine/S-adenosylhomocysteine nucleosidase [Nonomuraea sp. NEAU-A123]MBT2235512.1 5'-methylthioadenosine/S-adenosylhomocysteine nucleosidase [Nonomuraea sp. NEAU-A123]